MSSELPRSDAVGRRPARRVVDAWEQLRSLAVRAARGRRVVARALPKGLPLAVACSEAVALSKAYSGAHHTMVNGVLAAYAQDMKSRGLEVDTS